MLKGLHTSRVTGPVKQTQNQYQQSQRMVLNWKSCHEKHNVNTNNQKPKSIQTITMHGIEFYAPQTKIFEDRTKGRACLFEVLCEGVSTRFGLRTQMRVEWGEPKCVLKAM